MNRAELEGGSGVLIGAERTDRLFLSDLRKQIGTVKKRSFFDQILRIWGSLFGPFLFLHFLNAKIRLG